MKNFDKRIFLNSTISVGLLLIPCFFAAWGDDEGTLGSNRFWMTFSKVFYILRFPTHTLFWKFFSFNAVFFFVGLILNCMFYGLLIERTIFLFKFAKAKGWNSWASIQALQKFEHDKINLNSIMKIKSVPVLFLFLFGKSNSIFAQLSDYELKILADNNLSRRLGSCLTNQFHHYPR